MQWLEVSITTENETAEAVAEVLSRYAHRGVVIEADPDGWNAGPVAVRAYLPVDHELPDRKRRVEEALWHLGQIRPIPDPSFRPVADADWAEEWKKKLGVVHLGQRIVVCPSWRQYAPTPEEVVITLDPGMAFGTGLHPTTRMCLIALEELVRPGTTVLDMGTGSGILSIAAARLGAGQVLAIDNDPAAVKVARENVAANGVGEIVRVRLGSLEHVAEGYSLVLVNILAKVIVEMAREGLAERAQPGGKLVAAGLIDSQESDVATALEEAGLRLVDRRQSGDWICLIGEPK